MKKVRVYAVRAVPCQTDSANATPQSVPADITCDPGCASCRESGVTPPASVYSDLSRPDLEGQLDASNEIIADLKQTNALLLEEAQILSQTCKDNEKELKALRAKLEAVEAERKAACVKERQNNTDACRRSGDGTCCNPDWRVPVAQISGRAVLVYRLYC